VGELAALVAAGTWSATSVALTSLSARTSPVVLSALRLTAGGLALLLVLALSGQAGDVAAASGFTLLAMVGSGFVGYGLGDTLYIRALSLLGMQRTFPISMALFLTLTVVGGVVLLDEPFSWSLPAGTALIAAGIYLIVVPSRTRSAVPVAALAPVEPALASFGGLPAAPEASPPAPRDRREAEGYVLLLLVGVLWACATLWLAAGKGDLGAIAAGSMRTPAGAVALLAFALATQRPQLFAPFANRRHIGAIVAAGLAGTAFGSLLYVYAVVTAGAARTAVLSATSPLLALPLSILFLGERLTQRVGAGTVLCVLGIVLVVA
jgi:drug/metabolite transporter (DMT)-like permease